MLSLVLTVIVTTFVEFSLSPSTSFGHVLQVTTKRHTKQIKKKNKQTVIEL